MRMFSTRNGGSDSDTVEPINSKAGGYQKNKSKDQKQLS